MSLLALGLGHRTAPVELRERLAISSRDLTDWLRAVRTETHADELVILSTCNRTEFYLSCHDPSRAADRLFELLQQRSELSASILRRLLYRFDEQAAVAHLFSVAVGLDSMILGESEITAQVKRAYGVAQALGSAGPVMNRLMQKALHCAKVIRSRTRIAHGQASIGSVVARLARELFGERLSQCAVLLWGAGKAGEATARHLVAGGAGKLWIVNRTQDKAIELATLCQGGWLSWERALRCLASVDIAIICTQAPHYVVDRADLATVLPARGGRPLCLVDLALPRNIDPDVASAPGVRLYNIDDLESIARVGLEQRQQEVQVCRSLIEQQVGYFVRRHRQESWKEVVACGASVGSF